MKFAHILVIYAILLGMVACDNGTKYQKEIDQLDGLMNTVDSIEEVLHAIDTAKVRMVAATVPADLQYIQMMYQDTTGGVLRDTMNIETGIILERYYQIRKGIDGFDGYYTTLQENITYSRDQLWRLTENLKVNTFDDATTTEYVGDEIVVVNEMRMELKSLMEGVEFAFTRFDTINPLINDIIADLELKSQ